MAEVVTAWAGVRYLLSDYGALSAPRWSTSWPGGCESASVQIDVPPSVYTNAIMVGADFTVFDGPTPVFAGFISEYTPATDDAPASIQALGFRHLGAYYLALAANDRTPTTVLSTAVGNALTKGLPWVTSGVTLPSAPITATSETQEINTLTGLLDAWTANNGTRWGVDEYRRLFVSTDPTSPKWFYDNPDTVRGTADDDYVSNLYGRYVSNTADNTVAGDPTAWATVVAGANVAANLRREQALDLRDLGLMTSTTAQTITNAEAGLIAARYAYTEALTPSYGELTNPGLVPTRLGHVKAGESVRIFSVADNSGRRALGATRDVTIAGTDYTDGETSVQLTPVGFAPRTFGERVKAEKAARDAAAARLAATAV